MFSPDSLHMVFRLLHVTAQDRNAVTVAVIQGDSHAMNHKQPIFLNINKQSQPTKQTYR